MCQDVNPVTGVVACFSFRERLFYDKSDQLIANVATRQGWTCRFQFVDEYSLVAIGTTGLSFFDMRMLPAEDYTKQPDIVVSQLFCQQFFHARESIYFIVWPILNAENLASYLLVNVYLQILGCWKAIPSLFVLSV
jgi:hypothetical protein